MTCEVWMPVPRYEGLYEVSNLGCVRRIAPGRGTFIGRHLTASITPNGYHYVCVMGERMSLNRLVCLVFNGPAPPLKPEAAHLDGVQSNNRFDNLEWKDRIGNCADKKRHGTENPPRGEKNGHARLTEADVRSIIVRLSSGVRAADIAREYGVAHGTIGFIKRGKNWKHLGLVK